MPDALQQRVLAGFALEAVELCRRATSCLLELEPGTLDAAAAKTAYEQLARDLHTLKGTSRTLGLDLPADLAHAMEDRVRPLQEALDPIPSELADALLAGLDGLLTHVRAEAAGEATNSAALQAALARLRGTDAPGSVEAQAPSETATRDQAFGTWRVEAGRIAALTREVERLRDVQSRLEEHRRAWHARASEPPSTAASQDFPLELAAIARALATEVQDIGEIVESLEDSVRAVCAVPMSGVTEPLHRAVRDLCRAAGKRAKLSVIGAELSLDKRVVEAIRGPLVHLIRNAVDHGIEAPEVRQQRGKQPEGALVIRIEQQQEMASIEISDDGGGLDLARIEEVARRQGLISDEAPPQSIANLIFAPGFTTLEAATLSSGRGVGLDAVRTQVEALCGSVEVRSTPGQGTRFLIRIPVELGSSQQLVVRCGDHVFGVPLFAIAEVVAPRAAALQRARGAIHLVRGGQLLPIVDLGGALGLRGERPQDDRQRLLVISTPGERPALALVVDEVASERELVVRPLPPQLRELPAYLGVSTLPDGEPLLVLRPEWLVGTARIPAGHLRLPAAGGGDPAGTRPS